MLFDVNAALAEILNDGQTVATLATSATNKPETPAVSRVSRVSQATPAEGAQPDASAPRTSSPEVDDFRHGCSPAGKPLTWTGRIVSLDAWRGLTDWERHGSTGLFWNVQSRQWEHPDGGAA